MVVLGNEIKKDAKFYLKLFWATFTLSAFTVGGGYVIIPLMQKKFVEGYKWLSEEEMLNYVAIGQSAPGVIAVNVSILVGFGIAGALGALCTILGTVLPPMVIIMIISYFYEAFKDNALFKAIMLGLSCAVAAIIVDAVVSMAVNIIKQKDVFSVVIMFASLTAAVVFNVNVIVILIICIALGVLLTLFKGRKSL